MKEYYFSRLYAGQAKRGSNYDECKRVVIIAIIDYELDLTKDIKKWKLSGSYWKQKILN